jgi:hypothetical protein
MYLNENKNLPFTVSLKYTLNKREGEQSSAEQEEGERSSAEQEECVVCYQATNTETICKHTLCQNCLDLMCERNNNCDDNDIVANIISTITTVTNTVDNIQCPYCRGYLKKEIKFTMINITKK